MKPPRIAVTAGEPAGIGPDLLVELAQHAFDAELIAIADPELLAAAARALGLPLQLSIHHADFPVRAQQAGMLTVIPIATVVEVVPGQLDPANAAYVVRTLQRASDGALSGEFDAIVTAPVHKGAVIDGGIAFTGHTEFFAQRAGVDVVMMLAAPQLRVALATTHLPLSAVPAAITREGLRRSLEILLNALRERFAIDDPRVAVLGLNPHAGESGHLGREEIDIIVPLLDELRAAGHRIEGPLAADTAFVPSRLAATDAYLAMYHDQGLPVLKALGFGAAVNATLGLPYARTSVDHGVALDLARSGRADASSLIAATGLAIQLAHGKGAPARV